MDKIILYQVELTDEMISYLNSPEGGWSKAADKYQAIECHLECGSVFGDEGWESEYFQHYRAVAEIETDNLEEAFGIGNGSHHEMVEVGKMKPLLPMRKGKNGNMYYDMHSMSVGDICQKGDEYFMCNPHGFGQIEVPN